MNAHRRKALEKLSSELETLVALIADIRSELETIRDEEQEYMDNMPESFQGSEKYEVASQAVSTMEDAISALEEFEGQDFSNLTGE